MPRTRRIGALVRLNIILEEGGILTIELAKKFFVTFELCLLTFSVYIGSAIYSAGEMDVESVFQVSEASATLGLTMFVLGYGTGMSF